MASESQYSPLLLEELDYGAQFLAIRRLLYIHEQDRKHLHEEIEEMREFADTSSGDANWMAADEWSGLCYMSCYQDAAHSMAAAGMIAPFIESVFQHAFPTESEEILYGKEFSRVSMDEKVMTLVEKVGIGEHMPSDLKLTLSALFTYRNKMFHHGFEWPRRNWTNSRGRSRHPTGPRTGSPRRNPTNNPGCSTCRQGSWNTAWR